MEKVTLDLFSDWHNALQMNIVVELPPMVLAPLVSVTNFAMVEVLPKKRRHLWVLDNDLSISLEAFHVLTHTKYTSFYLCWT